MAGNIFSTITGDKTASGKSGPAAYKTVTGGQDSIFSNLMTTQKGLARTVGAQNQRLLAGMDRISSRGSARVAKAVSRGAMQSTNLFGTAIQRWDHGVAERERRGFTERGLLERLLQ